MDIPGKEIPTEGRSGGKGPEATVCLQVEGRGRGQRAGGRMREEESYGVHGKK